MENRRRAKGVNRFLDGMRRMEIGGRRNDRIFESTGSKTLDEAPQM